ncbi:hypothetical protein MUA04_10965 [Enterobacteriaceae bacterium H11S18]|uniref:hypothetical protein n=1 Tax=Enterobacteriaceae TaxID=543 RepID=UPI0019265968|nr:MULTISPECIES: hypothetical protein [Enterobacteriaceae]MCT4704569.1 hypothetical protein [Dryocola clanedunensis]MCT4710707.1 hypothetical protein [Dryocola clanedunensis]
MKTLTAVLLASALCTPLLAAAADATVPWADNSGGTETQHIAAMGENLNAQHQAITQTQEGTWADNSGSIKADEQALQSNKPAVATIPGLMPHQG